MSVGKWTTETYRLDEVTKKFSLPCVVCFSEGYMDDAESESISKDDIIKIDKRVTLQKVAAEFVDNPDDPGVTGKEMLDTDDDDQYVQLRAGEILIPLNYAGTVKTLHRRQICHGFKDLQRAFPRYALALSNTTVNCQSGSQVTIQAGTRIELDRTIPGNHSRPECLVISFDQNGREVTEAVLVSNLGRFKTLPDHNEYTLNEVIDRYGFPVEVSFVDDEIRRIYTMDIEEGISNMKLISATLRLKRLQSQDAIIGHYKPLEDYPDTTSDSDYFMRRTLVVCPLDNPAMKEIQVHVLLDTEEEIYDQIFLVSNKSSELNDFLDGTLYVDFAKKPGPRRLSMMPNGGNRKESKNAPPVPPKTKAYFKAKEKINSTGAKNFDPGRKVSDGDYLSPPSWKSKTGAVLPVLPEIKTQPQEPDPDYGFEDYEEMNLSPLVQPYEGLSLAEMNFDKYGAVESKPDVITSLGKNLKKIKTKVLGKKEESRGGKSNQIAPSKNYTVTTPTSPVKDVTTQAFQIPPSDEDDMLLYDYPDTEELMALRWQTKNSVPAMSENQKPTFNKPVAHISPQNAPKSANVKPFRSLSKLELEKRLIQCGMQKFAVACRERDLDGKFFDNISDDVLQKAPFKLDNFDLVKLAKVRQDWVPS